VLINCDEDKPRDDDDDDELTDADVDGVLSDGAFEEATAAVTADGAVVFAVTAIAADSTDRRRTPRHRTTCTTTSAASHCTTRQSFIQHAQPVVV